MVEHIKLYVDSDDFIKDSTECAKEGLSCIIYKCDMAFENLIMADEEFVYLRYKYACYKDTYLRREDDETCSRPKIFIAWDQCPFGRFTDHGASIRPW